MNPINRRSTQFSSYYCPKIMTLGDNFGFDYYKNKSQNSLRVDASKSIHNWSRLPYCMAKNPYYNHRRNYTVMSAKRMMQEIPKTSDQSHQCITRSWYIRKKIIENKYSNIIHCKNIIDKSKMSNKSPKMAHKCILQLYNRNVPHKSIINKMRSIIFENSFISQRMKESI